LYVRRLVGNMLQARKNVCGKECGVARQGVGEVVNKKAGEIRKASVRRLLVPDVFDGPGDDRLEVRHFLWGM